MYIVACKKTLVHFNLEIPSQKRLLIDLEKPMKTIPSILWTLDKRSDIYSCRILIFEEDTLLSVCERNKKAITIKLSIMFGGQRKTANKIIGGVRILLSMHHYFVAKYLFILMADVCAYF